MKYQQEPGRIVSIVDEQATFEAGVVAPIPKNQSLGELIIFFFVLCIFGAGIVAIASLVYDYITPDKPIYTETYQNHNTKNTAPRE